MSMNTWAAQEKTSATLVGSKGLISEHPIILTYYLLILYFLLSNSSLDSKTSSWFYFPDYFIYHLASKIIIKKMKNHFFCAILETPISYWGKKRPYSSCARIILAVSSPRVSSKCSYNRLTLLLPHGHLDLVQLDPLYCWSRPTPSR